MTELDANLSGKGRTTNITFGTIINDKAFVVNVDPLNHVIIYDQSKQVVGNGEWDPELRVIKHAAGLFSEEEWDLLDEIVCDSELGKV